jgi:DeoR family transcriptional regulator, suf operon transcriptional repressor
LSGYKGKETILGETKGRILQLLLESPKTAAEIGDKLQIQKSAVRTHLDSMQTEQVVRSYFKIEGFGRPKRIYELTESGHELFPRKYDMILLLILKKIEELNGQEQLKKIIESITDNIADDIKDKLQKNNSSGSLEPSLKMLNSVSNEMGFVSSIIKDHNAYSLISRNCIIHKAALNNQDAICDGFHNRMIKKTLDGELNVNVQLKDCIALGNNYCRHIITTKSGRKKK